MSAKILSPAQVAATKKLLLWHGILSGGGKDLVTQLADSHDLIDYKYRRSLWLSHGCFGECLKDDGEMLCIGTRAPQSEPARHPALDFKRDTILRLEEEISKAKLTESGIIIPGLNDDHIKFAKPGQDIGEIRNPNYPRQN